MSEKTSLVGQVISGCEILQKTAEGGMGAVYRARHKALNRIVCVKILSPALATDKKAVELFLTEARAIAELDHPNIVNVYNVGKEHGYYFIVMSFVEGQTLSALLKKQRVIPVGQVLDLFDGVLQGLNAAHEKGIIHRDIKPSNILINPQGQPKIVDFGIAKKMDTSGNTKTTELAGTAYFIAPEQALGRNLDTRADLYSIGASLYYVLTGQFPYNGKNTIEIIQKHINNPVPNPNDLRKDLPAWLGPAIQKLMSKNPEDRFQTAKETYSYFRKMRADDQLRLKTGNAGKAIDLGQEGPLIVVKEDRMPTQTLRTLRASQAKKNTHSTHPTVNSSLMPKLNAASNAAAAAQAAPVKKAPSRMQDASHVKPIDTFTATSRSAQTISTVASLRKKIVSFIIFMPLFALIAGAITYLFHQLGTVCSVHVNASAGLIHNILFSLIPKTYAPNQLLLSAICIGAVAAIFAVSMFKAFARSTTTLLFLAFVSFLAGLFTPHVPFMRLSHVSASLFSPEFYLCYLVIALAWGVSLCGTINRSIGQGVLGSVLVVFCSVLAYLSSSLSIAPNNGQVLYSIILYASIFCGICAAFYLLSRTYKDSVFLPLILLLVSVGGIWVYCVSGLATSMLSTLDVLASRVEVNTYANIRAEDTSSTPKDLIPTSTAFRNLDRSNEFTGLSLRETTAALQPRLEKAAPNVFDEETSALFAGLLAPYYQGGTQRMKMGVWNFALTLPVHNFNYDAQENDAYFFLITMLYVFGLCGCAGTILFGEDL